MNECASKKRCLWGVALFASLALNLFLAGVLVGKPPQERNWHSPMGRMERQIEQLPEPYRKEARMIFDSYRPEFKQQMHRVMATRGELEKLMRSEKYSREATQEKFFELSEEYGKLHEIGQEMTLEIADTLPPAERIKLLPKPGWKKPH